MSHVFQAVELFVRSNQDKFELLAGGFAILAGLLMWIVRESRK